MEEEIGSIKKNNIWTLVKAPKSYNPIGEMGLQAREESSR